MEECIKKLINEYDVISFDLFDTLFLRHCNHPTDVFSYIGGDEFRKKRIEAEQTARFYAAKNGRSEVTFHEIYKNLSADKLFEELEAEKKVIYINEKIREYLEFAKEAGKKIIIVSDMYLPVNFLKDILKQHNIYYDKIYVSSQYIKETKHNKSIWNIVKLDFVDKQILHFDDNIYICKNIESVRDVTAINVPLYRNDNVKLKTNDESLHYSLVEKNFNTDFWYNIGYKYIGITCLKMINLIIQDKEQFDEILFASRDGYLPHLIYEEIKEKDWPESSYIKTSRILQRSEDKETKRVYAKYLSQWKNKRLACFDIGWLGGFFNYLDKSELNLVKGYYFGYLGKNERVTALYPITTTWGNFINSFNVEIFESLMTAPHNSCIDVKEVKEKYFIYFVEDDKPAKNFPLEKVFQGAIQFCKDFRKIQKEFNIEISRELITNIYQDLFMNPTMEEAKNLGEIEFYNGEFRTNIGSLSPLALLNEKVRQYQYNIVRWKHGYIKLLNAKIKEQFKPFSIQEFINNLKDEKIVCFGASTNAYTLFRESDLSKKNIVAFLDNFVTGEINGIKIYKPEEFLNAEIDYDFIIFTMFEPYLVKEQCRELGLKVKEMF